MAKTLDQLQHELWDLEASISKYESHPTSDSKKAKELAEFRKSQVENDIRALGGSV